MLVRFELDVRSIKLSSCRRAGMIIYTPVIPSYAYDDTLTRISAFSPLLRIQHWIHPESVNKKLALCTV